MLHGGPPGRRWRSRPRGVRPCAQSSNPRHRVQERRCGSGTGRVCRNSLPITRPRAPERTYRLMTKPSCGRANTNVRFSRPQVLGRVLIDLRGDVANEVHRRFPNLDARTHDVRRHAAEESTPKRQRRLQVCSQAAGPGCWTRLLERQAPASGPAFVIPFWPQRVLLTAGVWERVDRGPWLIRTLRMARRLL